MEVWIPGIGRGVRRSADRRYVNDGPYRNFPLLGRSFVTSDATAKGDTVVVLGYDFWQRHFKGDPNVLGQTIKITRAEPPLAIVGVMPPGVRFVLAFSNADFPNYDINARVDCWIPITAEHSQYSEWNVAARLRPGVTLEQANAELAAVTSRQARAKRQLDGITAGRASPHGVTDAITGAF